MVKLVVKVGVDILVYSVDDLIDWVFINLF